MPRRDGTSFDMQSSARFALALITAWSTLTLASTEPAHASDSTAPSTQTSGPPVQPASFAETSSKDQLAWKDAWPRFRPAEIAFTVGMGLQAAAATFLYTGPQNNWEGGILIDDPVRDLVRFRTRSARATGQAISDAFYYGLLAYPLVVDTPILFARGGSDLGVQTLGITLEAFALGGAIALSAEKLGRRRPLAGECDKNPSYDATCGAQADLNSSFLSGHTTIAFVGAAVLCAHHLHLPVYGGGAPDTATCIAAGAMALSAGALRVMSDKHYFSDVFLGATVGFGAGFILPAVLHYRGVPREGRIARTKTFLPTLRGAGVEAIFAPAVGPSNVGISTTGLF